MNLHDTKTPYIALSSKVLTIGRKVPLLAAIRLYALGKISSPLPLTITDTASPYQKRQLKDTRLELETRNVIFEGSGSWDLIPIASEDRVLIPAQYDYSLLSYGELKTLIACHARCRYSRESFRFQATQRLLAKEAGLTERRLRDALGQLEQRRLVIVKKLWRESQITLLDPKSGIELYFIGKFYRDQLDRMLVHERYEQCLASYDSTGSLGKGSGPVNNFPVVCPFCKSRSSRQGTMRIYSADGEDSWFCHACKRSGTSASLWHKLMWWNDRGDWRKVMAGLTADEDMLAPTQTAAIDFAEIEKDLMEETVQQ